MQFELLDRRMMMAQTGVDSTFGSAGKLTLPASVDSTPAVLSTSNAIYVEVTAQNKAGVFEHYLYKYNADGRRVSTWGTNGRAFVNFDVRQLAYDKRTGMLYAGGQGDGTAANPALSIFRLTSEGKADLTFGIAGYAGYTPVSSVPDTSASALVEKIVPLAHKQVLIAFERTTSKNIGNSTSPNEVGEDEAVLMRLRANGTRDPGFGSRGTLTLLGGSKQDYLAEFNYGGMYKSPKVVDLQPQSDGSFKVILSREAGGYGSGSAPNTYSANETFEIKSRTVSATGIIDTATAYSWTLLNAGTGDNGNTFEPLFVGYDGNDQISVVGKTTAYSPYDPDNGGITTTKNEPFFYKLTPGARPRAAVFSTSVGIASVSRDSRGSYFAGIGYKAVVKLTNDLNPDVRFGDKGRVSLEDSNTVWNLLPDTEGRALIFIGSTVMRLT